MKKLLFFGTPHFALAPLRALTEDPQYEIVGIVTQPDKPAGRGQELTPPPVKVFASEKNIPVFQPRSLRGIERSADGEVTGTHHNEELVNFLNTNSPFDAFVVVAYGKIIVPALLDLPRSGIVNIHASLLPRWRGACPIQWALFSGDAESGVCLMRIEEGLDTGGVFARRSIPITAEDTTGSLFEKLSTLGAALLKEHLPKIISGELRALPQPEEGTTYAERWERSHCEIQWHESAEKTVRRIRTCAPSPGARTTFNSSLFKIFNAKVVKDATLPPAAPGTIVETNRAEVIVATGEGGYISLEEIQLAGKKRLSIREALCGQRFERGERFSIEVESQDHRTDP